MSDAPDLCLFRLSAIGDVTHALAVLDQIQRHRPEARLTWIIGKLEHKLLKGLAGVEFIVYDKKSGIPGWLDLRRRLSERRFDALLLMQVAARANLASLCIRADRRIGFDRARSRDGHGLFINQRIAARPHQHVLDGLMGFLEPLGIVPDAPRWPLPLSESDHAFAREHVDTARPTLVISACSSHRLRNWPSERYAAVADHAIEQHGFQVILMGGPSDFERDVAGRIEAAMRQAVDNLVGQDTLKQGAAVLAAADLVVAPDTGPAHMANAVGTPVIGLYAASNPRRSGPYHGLEWTVDRYDEAARQFLGKPSQDLRWGTKVEVPGAMELITVEDVTGRIDRFAAGLQR